MLNIAKIHFLVIIVAAILLVPTVAFADEVSDPGNSLDSGSSAGISPDSQGTSEGSGSKSSSPKASGGSADVSESSYPDGEAPASGNDTVMEENQSPVENASAGDASDSAPEDEGVKVDAGAKGGAEGPEGSDQNGETEDNADGTSDEPEKAVEDKNNEAAEDKEQENESEDETEDVSGDEKKLGQTYATELTPGGVVGTGKDTQFEFTIKEVGSSNIAEVIIDSNDFMFVSLDELDSSTEGWVFDLDEGKNNLTFVDGDPLYEGDWLTAFFTATTPPDPGIYSFDISVKKDDGSDNTPQSQNQNDDWETSHTDDKLSVAVKNTVQGAIDSSSINDGDTIHVHPDSYNENLIIEKPLNLIGIDGSEHTRVIANDKDREILLVQGEKDNPLQNVTVKGFTFSGEQIQPDGTWIYGIRIRHTEHSIFDDLVVTNIGGPDANEVAGVSVIGGGNNTFNSLTVDEMEGMHFNWGLRLIGTVNNEFASTAVRNLADPHSSLLHTTGIYMTSNSNGNLFTDTSFDTLNSARTTHVIWLAGSHENKFFNTNISEIHGDRQTSGVFIEFDSSENEFINTTIENMTTSNPGLIVVGLHTQSNAGSGNCFIQAEITGLQGPNLARGFSLHAPNTVFKNVNVNFSTFEGAGITRAGQIALAGSGEIIGGHLVGADQGLFVSESSIDPAVTIEEVLFENNASGLLIGNGSWAGDLSELIVKNNIFKGGNYGVENRTGEILDARFNNWGNDDGPGTHPDDLDRLGGFVLDPVTGKPADGTGSAVSENVRFDTWFDNDSGAVPPIAFSPIGIVPITFPPIKVDLPALPDLSCLSEVFIISLEPRLVITPKPVVTVEFVLEGTAAHLAEAREVYEQLLVEFEEKQGYLSERKTAIILLDLAAGKAGILALEARLADEAGEEVDLEKAVEVYRLAMEYLADYKELLTEEQLVVVQDVLAAVKSQLEALGVDLEA